MLARFPLGDYSFFAAVCLRNDGTFSVDSDLFNMLPKAFEEDSIKRADENLTKKISNIAIILTADQDFEKAKDGAEKIYGKINGSPNFTSVNFRTDSTDIEEISSFFFKYRYSMIDEKTADLLESGGEEDLASEALALAYSPVTMLPIDNLGKDPFMLAEHNFRNYLEILEQTGSALKPKNGVLAAQKNDLWYVMIKAELSPKGAALASEENGVTEIYDICGRIKAETGTRCVFSGSPYHSHKSSVSASEEIKIISIISMAVVILVLFLVFRSLVPIVFSALSVALSLFAAAAMTFAVFGKVHLVTLVFGTSLIGSSIDYSLHYFIYAAGNMNLSSDSIRSKLLPGLRMAIISSAICFAALMFAPFGLLKQISLFSVSGLVSSFLTTVGIYPLLPSKQGSVSMLRFFGRFSEAAEKISGRAMIFAMTLVSLVLIFVFSSSFGIKNDIRNLYKETGDLLQNEAEAAAIMPFSRTSWFIISGKDENEVLQNEEQLRKNLTTLDKNNAGTMGVSRFIPSHEKQKRSRKAAEKLLKIADSQLAALDFGDEEAEKLEKDFAASENRVLSAESEDLPSVLSETLSAYWLGKIKDKYYTVLIPNFAADPAAMRALAEGKSHLFFVNKKEDINSDLDRITKTILGFFIAAYILIFIVLRFFYTAKQTIKIISIPFIVILSTFAVFAAAGTKLEFFSVTGLILVFGLGLDYIIYTQENEKSSDPEERKLKAFAVFLSFFTTIVSFGALALSSFQPVHLIGCSILTGLCAAYLAALFYSSGEKK